MRSISLSPHQRRVFAEREALDSSLSRIHSARIPVPKKGWIKSIREALGMRIHQLAKRVGIDGSTISRLEENEIKGTITLESLRRIAEAMDCELVYALVPRKPLLAIINERAALLLEKDRNATLRSMELEEQSEMTNDSVRDDIIKSLLVTKLSPRLWDDP